MASSSPSTPTQWGLNRTVSSSSPPLPYHQQASMASLLSSASTTSLLPLRRHSVYGFEDRLVLDFGALHVKVGLSGEQKPRYHLPITVPSIEDPNYNAGLYEPMLDHRLIHQRREALIDLFLSIYNKYILTDSKQRKVIICDKVLMPMPIKLLIADVLYRVFQVPAIQFANADLLALMCFGRGTGIVIDIGHLETTVVPVYDGRPLYQLVKMAPLGGKTLIDRFKLLIKNHGSIKTSDSQSTAQDNSLLLQILDSQPEQFWHNLVAQTVLVAQTASRMDMVETAQRNPLGPYAIYDPQSKDVSVRVPYEGNTALLTIPGWVRERATEVWFEGAGTIYSEDDSVVSLILDALVKCPVDIRTDIAAGLVVTGGGAMVPGVMGRIETDLKSVGGDSGFLLINDGRTGGKRSAVHRFDEVRRLVRDRVKVLRSVFGANLLAWVGGSLVGSLKMVVKELIREDYLAEGAQLVPDWSRLGDTLPTPNRAFSVSGALFAGGPKNKKPRFNKLEPTSNQEKQTQVSETHKASKNTKKTKTDSRKGKGKPSGAKGKPDDSKLQPQPPPPPPPPKHVPPAKKYFPDFIQQPVDSFLNYYCKRFNLSLQERSESFSAKLSASKRSKASATKWTSHYSIPAHSLPDEYSTPSIDAITMSATASARITSKLRGVELLASHLLYAIDPKIVDEFIEFATPVKRKILKEIETPPVISMSDELLSETESLLENLKATNAFRVGPPRVSLMGGDQDLDSEWDGFGRKRSHHTPSSSSSSHSAHKSVYTDPKSITVPSELAKAKDLPMYQYYANVMAAIDNNPVVVIAASTGAGKTTQLPQFILAHFKAQKEAFHGLSSRKSRNNMNDHPVLPRPPSVIVTQPRRIAAISVAQRVARERGETMGRDSAIGYTVRFNSVAPKSDPEYGHVVFCTSGILLRRLQDDPDLRSVTHIILDEIHERDLNTDLLLIVVRQLVQRRPDLKIILMSATADTALFSKYFGKVNASVVGPPPSPVRTPMNNSHFKSKNTTSISSTPVPSRLAPPPIINIPGRLFPVKEFYLEDVLNVIRNVGPNRFLYQSQKYINSELHYEPPRFASSLYTTPSSGMADFFPVDIYEALLVYITKTRGPGAVLVFLPGWQEISLLMQKLKDDTYHVGFGDSRRVRLYALHSSVSSSGQEEVFERPPEGVRKIILSTNIAETSVTINDIVYVVDSARIRINTYDPSSRLSSLNCVVASQSNLKQRSGRAGRCQAGEYFSLISKRHHESLPYSIPPELLRIDLQSTALKIKALNLSPFTADVLALAPQPPSSESVEKALRDLHTLGALTTSKGKHSSLKSLKLSSKSNPTRKGDVSDTQEVLTPLGKAFSQIPMDPWLAKLIILGTAFKALDPVLTAAAVLESGNRGVYSIHPDEREQARLHILQKFVCGRDESYGSDLLAMATAYWDWKLAPVSAGIKRRDFAEKNYLNHNGLMNVDRAKEQVLKSLQDLRIVENSGSRRSGGNRGESELGVSTLAGVDELFGGRDVNEFSRNTDLVRALISASLFPNVAEAREKNVYGSTLDWKLKLTGSTMNSYSSLQMVEDAKHHPNRMLTLEERPRTTLSSSDDPDSDDILLEDDSKYEIQMPIVPPRFLSYHEKQMLEGAVWLRTTTIAEPIGLLLFGSFGEHESRLNWIQGTDGKWVALLGGWLRVEFENERTKIIVEQLRDWMNRYLSWTVSEDRIRSDDTDRQVGQLVEVVSRMVSKDRK
ncbi:hypothetical protein BDR26DRAFT_1004848 [Obelidium mucronatum]|nr:hypothetical protein BDR26DRAFT_1004848 [Obelidium mucronatum]